MEQEYLSQKEINEYIINRLDTDTEIDNANNVTSLSSLAYFICFDPTGKTKEELLDELYLAFKNYLFFEYSRKKHLSPLKTSKFLPYKTLFKEVGMLGSSKTYNELNASEAQKIWVLKMLINAMRFAVGITRPRTEPRRDTQGIVSSIIQNMPYFDYRNEIEGFFKYTIATRADAMTLNLLDKLKIKVERLVKIEVAKTNTNGNTNQLLENAQNEKLNIISNISFGLEWHDLGQPTIKQTNILCRWEEQEDYELFVEKLLLIDSLENSYLGIIYPNCEEKMRKTVDERNKKEKAKKNKRIEETKVIIREYLMANISGRISESEFANVVCAIQILFETLKLPKNIMAINSIKDLKQGDIRALLYNIWMKYDNELCIKLDQMLLAEYIKRQFPHLFRSSEIKSIKSHIRRGGKIIKIGVF